MTTAQHSRNTEYDTSVDPNFNESELQADFLPEKKPHLFDFFLKFTTNSTYYI